MLLDTRTVAPAERAGYWSAGIAANFFPIQVDPTRDVILDLRLAGGRFGVIAVHTIAGAPHRVTRSRRMIAAGDPEAVVLTHLRSGACQIEQDGRGGQMLVAGDVAVHETSRPSSIQTTSESDLLIFSLRKQLVGGERAPEALMAMLEPIRAAVSAPRPSASQALLARMRRYALEHLGDPGLGPERLADLHYVSTRTVHKLFAGDGGGVSAWIRERRLDAALVALQRSSAAGVAEVAARFGYRDASAFSRAFRQQHGCSPSEARSRRVISPPHAVG